MPRKKPKIDLFLVSDDVREELNNKVSLMGVYLEGKFNIKLPGIIKLCFNLFFRNVQAGDKFRMSLLDPDGNVVLNFISGPADDVVTSGKVTSCAVTIIAGGIKINKSGTYLFRTYFADEKKPFDVRKLQFNAID